MVEPISMLSHSERWLVRMHNLSANVAILPLHTHHHAVTNGRIASGQPDIEVSNRGKNHSIKTLSIKQNYRQYKINDWGQYKIKLSPILITYAKM